jgi:curli biogenesis system outer membrane secretion channel CsgG
MWWRWKKITLFDRRRLWFFFILSVFIAGCATGPEVYEGPKNIAVWDLEDLSPMGDGRPDLGEFLSLRVIETLKKMGGYNVIERERLSLALEELNLGTSSLADESTRLRLGRLIGAQLMIFGGYQVIAEKMRLDLRLVEVGSGRILHAVEKTVSASDLSGWLNAAEAATRELFQNN